MLWLNQNDYINDINSFEIISLTNCVQHLSHREIGTRDRGLGCVYTRPDLFGTGTKLVQIKFAFI